MPLCRAPFPAGGGELGEGELARLLVVSAGCGLPRESSGRDVAVMLAGMTQEATGLAADIAEGPDLDAGVEEVWLTLLARNGGRRWLARVPLGTAGSVVAVHQRARIIAQIVRLEQAYAQSGDSSAESDELSVLARGLDAAGRELAALDEPMLVATGRVRPDHAWSAEDLRAQAGTGSAEVALLTVVYGHGLRWRSGRVRGVVEVEAIAADDPAARVLGPDQVRQTQVVLDEGGGREVAVPAHRVLWVLVLDRPRDRAAWEAVQASSDGRWPGG